MVNAMEIKFHAIKTWENFTFDMKFCTEQKRIGILGASGSGKSMTLKMIAGIETPEKGEIEVGNHIFFSSEQKINIPTRKRNVGYLFQQYALFPNMTVEKNIAAGISLSRRKKQERTREFIERFQLNGLEKRYPSQLSGGQQQRVALARILASEPEMILLDEPFSALDGHLKEAMQEELKGFLEDFEGSIIFVSHSRDEIYRFSDQLLIIENGSCILNGETREIFRTPKKKEAARLTGCKNISKIKKLGDYELFAEEWKIKLYTKEKIQPSIQYVGIRAHDLDAGREEECNTYKMDLVRCMEAPFEQVFYIRPCVADAKQVKIWWKQEKNLNWEIENRQFPCFVKFPPEKLLLLES